MNRFGLIGRNISHSFSEGYFKTKFANENIENSIYESYDLKTIQQVEKVFATDRLKGLNVTIPYKTQIIDYLDELDPISEGIGAVNCIKLENGKKTGYNTDVYGFEKSLRPLLEKHHKKALVLGSGGASKAVIYVLNKLDIPFQIVSRNGDFTYHDITAETLQDFQLIINCTPLGTFPNLKESPALPYHCLTQFHLLYDLTYNPPLTLFLQRGIEQGAKIKNGLEMLILQAEKSWEIWSQSL